MERLPFNGGLFCLLQSHSGNVYRKLLMVEDFNFLGDRSAGDSANKCTCIISCCSACLAMEQCLQCFPYKIGNYDR
jgi:hypothetical protein